MLHNQLYIRCEFAEKQIKKKDKVTIKVGFTQCSAV